MSFRPSAAERDKAHLAILKQYAIRNDILVDVVTSGPKPGSYVEKLSDNVTIYKVGVHKKNLHHWHKIEVVEWLAKAHWTYHRLIKENKYDLVHAFFGLPTGWLCYRTAKKLPYIISLRGSDVPGGNTRLQFEYKLFGPLLKRIWTRASALVACSEGLKTRALGFLSSANIDVIPNGVDLDKFYPAPAGELSGELKLVTVGRLSATKRVEMLIGAVEILSKKGTDVCLIIAGGGGGELSRQLKAMVGTKEINRHHQL